MKNFILMTFLIFGLFTFPIKHGMAQNFETGLGEQIYACAFQGIKATLISGALLFCMNGHLCMEGRGLIGFGIGGHTLTIIIIDKLKGPMISLANNSFMSFVHFYLGSLAMGSEIIYLKDKISIVGLSGISLRTFLRATGQLSLGAFNLFIGYQGGKCLTSSIMDMLQK